MPSVKNLETWFSGMKTPAKDPDSLSTCANSSCETFTRQVPEENALIAHHQALFEDVWLDSL